MDKAVDQPAGRLRRFAVRIPRFSAIRTGASGGGSLICSGSTCPTSRRRACWRSAVLRRQPDPFRRMASRGRAVGVDLSPVQINEGRGGRCARAHQRRAVQADIAQADLPLWVSSISSSATACTAGCPTTCSTRSCAFRSLLAPEGVGYLSYNTYPGWRPRRSSATRCCCAVARWRRRPRRCPTRGHDRLPRRGRPSRQRASQSAG